MSFFMILQENRKVVVRTVMVRVALDRPPVRRLGPGNVFFMNQEAP